MTIKEARTELGWSQAAMSHYLDIPKRTIENWESGVATPPSYVEALIVEKLQSYTKPSDLPFSVVNGTVKKYAEICKKFSNDSSDWSDLPFGSFYTTDGSYDWKESFDNAHGGIDVSWAFHLTEKQIDYRAAEQLFNALKEELQIAVDDGWEQDQLAEVLRIFDL